MSRDTTNVNSSFGQQVRDLRRQVKRLTQRELADEAGVENKTISRIESIKKGQSRSFDTKNLQSIAKALGTSLDELLNPMDLSSVRDEIIRYSSRGESVNLVTGEGSEWRELMSEIQRNFGVVDLENPATATRAGLVKEILKALGKNVEVPSEPGEDLVVLARRLPEQPASRLALLHFDLVEERSQYGLDLFHTLRYLIMEEPRKLLLLVQSRTPLSELLPEDHPISNITIQTVFLRG
jgi:transcriptional regulator with XRE-family HTH domain